ncbi:MAG: DUF1043 family protein [Neisseria sp.]|uniref:ZapG family protein n=1 Tax=Neisseria sp. TaxID=192066 RepID=UPI0026DC631F|nr:DUF1043 family protein [Neisseria sp.]MDO4641728.1 DUF1043 family protein [Neisseria sp.]
MNTLLLAHYALAALGGLILGILFTWLAMRGNKTLIQEKTRENEALSQQFNEYRSQVDRHFVDTAEAVDELNRSYQKVVQHLSNGAQSLMGKEALQEQLTLRSNKAVTVAYLADAAELEQTELQADIIEEAAPTTEPLQQETQPVETPEQESEAQVDEISKTNGSSQT